MGATIQFMAVTGYFEFQESTREDSHIKWRQVGWTAPATPSRPLCLAQAVPALSRGGARLGMVPLPCTEEGVSSVSQRGPSPQGITV